MLRRVALVRTDASEELSASFIRVTRISELGRTPAVTRNNARSVRRLLVTAGVVPSSPILVTLLKDALSSSETSFFTRATWHTIPEDISLNSIWPAFWRTCIRLRITGVLDFVHRREFVQWYKLALFKGPNRVGVTLTSPEGRNRFSFRNVMFYRVIIPGRWTKSRTPVILKRFYMWNSINFKKWQTSNWK
jgi:hypothetical protein